MERAGGEQDPERAQRPADPLPARERGRRDHRPSRRPLFVRLEPTSAVLDHWPGAAAGAPRRRRGAGMGNHGRGAIRRTGNRGTATPQQRGSGFGAHTPAPLPRPLRGPASQRQPAGPQPDASGPVPDASRFTARRSTAAAALKEGPRAPSNSGPANEAHGIAHGAGPARGPRPPDPLGVHPCAVRRVLALAEGRRAVHRRPPRRGRLPDGRGARPPREHVELDRRALLPGARLRGLPRAADLGARGVPPPRRGRPPRAERQRQLFRGAAVLARPERLRDRRRGRPRQRRGDRAAHQPPRRRGGHRRDQPGAARADRGDRPDGVLRQLPAPPADAARPSGRARREPVAGGAEPARADRRRDARDRAVGRAPASARRPRDEARAPSQGAHGRDHRRDALRGREARAGPAVLLLEQPGLRALAHRAARHDPGAGVRRVQPRRRAVRGSDKGVPPEVGARIRARTMSVMRDEATFLTKAGLAQMLQGGVIMDVVTPEHAKIAEDAGASAVMALERVPADIRRDGGVARMSDPAMIKGIQEAVTIPVMAKARIGHFAEAQVLEALEVDYIDESEVLTPADEAHHIDKWAFRIPFVCGATNLGEALRRISEGAAMIRSKGEAGTGDVVEAVRHMRAIRGEIRRLGTLDETELFVAAKELQAPYDIVRDVAQNGKLPVPLFSAGGIATPADASLMMQLGAESVFVGSGIFKSSNPEKMARAVVEAARHYADAERVAAASTGLGAAMQSLEARKLDESQVLANRGW